MANNKRRTIELLPGHLRTETLSKVFAATVDHMFQPESVEFLTGYIGEKPSWYDPLKDFYVDEPTKNRRDYQLSPTIVSRNYQSGRITNSLFYEDLIGQLRFQGAIVDNHSRLFDQEYYSWSPLIDLDKFINFNNYYWLPSGLPSIELLGPTDMTNDAVGKTGFTYSGAVRYQSTGEVEDAVISFSSGMKITLRNDASIDLNDGSFFVELVGRGIKLIRIGDDVNPGWDILAWDVGSWSGDEMFMDKRYATISRASSDGNQWSQTNRWFHVDLIRLSRALYPDPYLNQARRPIIEFDPDVMLWNYGYRNRGYIDLLDSSNGDALGSIVGQPSWEIDGIALRDGMRVAFLSDTTEQARNRIFVVSGVEAGSIELTVDTRGTIDGTPVRGDRFAVRFGSFQNVNVYFDGTSWVHNGQQMTSMPPLFDAYDVDGISMSDPAVYPLSSFAGTRAFGYSMDQNSVFDTELGFSTRLDQFGDYVFENHLETDQVTYSLDGRTVTYEGYLAVMVGNEYSNSWYRSPTPSRQYIVNEYEANGSTTTYQLDQEPAARQENTPPTIIVSYVSNGNLVGMIEGIDYSVSGRNLITSRTFPVGTRIIAKSWSSKAPSGNNGYYEIPKNLSANPNNLSVDRASRGQILEHLTGIISNQYGFEGLPIGVNNYRDLAQNRGLGLGILQHRAPLLKVGVINTVESSDVTSSVSKTDPMAAMQFAQRSYQRFYNRFLQALFNMANKQGFASTNSTACDPYMISQWVSTALKQINIGKTSASPWANSGPGDLPGAYCSVQSTNPTYVPASPARLGMTPAYRPVVYMDQSYPVPQLVIQTHDGSRIVMVNEDGEQLGTFVHGQSSTTNPGELTNPVAAAWLKFENDLYQSLPERYRDPETSLAFDIRTMLPGKWRGSDYTRNEIIRIQRASFDKWSVSNQVDYRSNTGYSTDDPFSFNYRSVLDRDGQPVPGYWQGMYRWFYDTDRPHTHPWEMLGFSQEPIWWKDEYGDAPYTSGNTAMWEDLRDGLIRQGPRQGTSTPWARPGLMLCIPVDDQGNLLPPYQAGTVASIPDVYSSRSEWIFGDGGPVESAWIKSQDYPFVLAQTGYLTKPARFVEYNWDILRTRRAYDGESSQWMYVDTNSRRSSNEFYAHRESPASLSIGTVIPNESNLSYFGSCGFQHWISEYLISQGLSVTQYLGNVVRGADVVLAHRMAGYTSADSLRTTVDSFGELGFNSQIIPGENVNVYLYRSTSIGESVYSGVLVEQTKDGWRIYGYDPVNQVFTTIPSNTNGARSTIVIGNQRVTEYSTGLAEERRVPYGSTLVTRQEVYDFIISYGRWLESQGWVFDQYSSDSNAVLDWTQSAKEFLFWSQGSWQNGTFIALSPSADSVGYRQEYGNIQYVNGIVSGAYPVVDRASAPILPQSLTIIRDEGSMTVKPTNAQGIFGLRLFRTTLEHAVFFDNSTAFGDVIYQPLYDLQQKRIKIYGYRTNGWNGRVDAPGYFITQNQNTGTWSMVSNLETTVKDFERYFNIDQPKNYTEIDPFTGITRTSQTKISSTDRKEISNLARHTIGYQDRKYLQNLLLEESTQFEFYQGFIRQKGTRSTIDKLLRNTSIIPSTSTFEYYEEWLIRTGTYGATSLNNIIEFRIPQSRVTDDPQWIRLFSQSDSDYRGDDVIDIVPGDPLIVTPPESYQDKIFATRTSYATDPSTDLPTAGYAMLGETTYMVNNLSDLFGLYESRRSTLVPLQPRDTVWQFVTDIGSWMVWILAKAISDIDITIPSQVSGTPTVIATKTEHGLLDGDIVVIYGVSGVNLINGTYVVTNATPKTFQIGISTYEQGVGGTILVYRPMRFATLFERDSGEPPGGWQDGDLVYVDDGGVVSGAWTVYKRISNAWQPYRQQELRVDASLLLSSKLYNSRTLDQVASVTYFDPIQGRISGRADAEIDYKVDYDPAKYNKGNSNGFALSEGEAWGSAQLGTVWWDLSTVRYIDYGIGDERYRAQHWGKIAPGTSIDVYEWIRSVVSPADWAGAAAQGESITDGSRSYTPSGSIRNPSNPSWTEVAEQGPSGTTVTYYYFWVKNSSMPSWLPSRRITTQNIANLVQDPSVDDLPWYAAMSERSILIGNITRRLNADLIVQQIKYASLPNSSNTYGEWELIREGDSMSPISDLAWMKMKDSLVTFDGLGNDVPDYHLNDLQKYGTTIRPRQTWFADRVASSKLFVDTFNQLIASNPTPMVDDPAMAGWQPYFERAEQPDDPANPATWDYRVADMSQRDGLVGVIVPGQTVLVDPVSVNNNLWTLWLYQSGANPWLLLRTQSYNTANHWTYVDWYLSGYGTGTEISMSVDTVEDLYGISSPSTGMVVRVDSTATGKWQIYSFAGDWVLVGQQDGSIEVMPSVYGWSEQNGFDSAPFESVTFDKTAAIEFANIIDGIRKAIYARPDSPELNTIFFAMIGYVVSEQRQVDWLIKTSDIVLKGFNQPLLQSQLLAADNIDSIIGFVNEAKPYHAKIREFISGKSKTDVSTVGLLDFDNVAGFPYDDRQGLARYSYDQAHGSWENNYLSNPDLIRTLKTTLIFDRISTPAMQGGWGQSWDIYGWDSPFGEGFGAAERIERFYEPLPGMLPKVVDQLMSGVAYRGLKLSALAFNIDVGWGIGPWGALLGWDADQDAISAYLDQIIQGGAIPDYDRAIGNGISRRFPLFKDVTNPNDMVVWSDGDLRIYGYDWIVPTFARAARVVSGGSGYSVGDHLDLVGGSFIAPVRLVVTSVSSGRITGVEIAGTGSYTMVTRGPYQVQAAPGHGATGSGAVIGIDWDCTTIEFSSPPQSSNEPNIYVLYAGTTFGAAPDGVSDTTYEGSDFVQPFVDDDHPEELYPVRLRDSMMIDVVNRKIGGRPSVGLRVYETDGVMDQFDLAVVPQGTMSVVAYLGGILLVEGAGNDYVINQPTKKIVMMSVPPAGTTLHLFSISTGGASRLVKNAYVVDPGIGYVPEQLIPLDPAVGVEQAVLSVTTVKLVSVSVVSGGVGYKAGDRLFLQAMSGVPVPDTATVLLVDNVDSNGEITSILVENPGEWFFLPPTASWQVDRDAGAGFEQADIQPDWGVASVSVANPGKYARIPDQPISQDPLTIDIGTGATWNLRFDSSIGMISYVGDGITDYFEVPMMPPGIFVTVNGVQYPYTRGSSGVTLLSIPPYGSTIHITTFGNDEFSVVSETPITITNPSVLTYPLSVGPASTLPGYLSTVVLRNGSLVEPPLMQQFRGNGYQLSWQITIDLSSAISVEVYVDQVLQTSGYAIDVSDRLIFNRVIPDGADIQVLCIKSTSAYTISGSNLIFAAGQLSLGDEILAITYTQDLDYEFHCEQFDFSQNAMYPLTKLAWDTDAIRVWKDGVPQVPTVDFIVVTEPASTGWDLHGWDTSAWELGIDERSVVVFDRSTHAGSRIVVNYMTGLPEKPSIAWRTLSTGTNTMSVALDASRTTVVLSNVFAYSSSIEISDYRAITLPTATEQSMVYINDELIGFAEMHVAPTVLHPYRAFITGLQRNLMGTSGNPRARYNIQFYDGNGTETYFATEAAAQAIGETVWLGERFQVEGTDFEFVENPPSKPAGRYVMFYVPPKLGHKNVKIASLNSEGFESDLSHLVLSTVVDAGERVRFPTPYQWEPTPRGMQYERTPQSLFLLNHDYDG